MSLEQEKAAASMSVKRKRCNWNLSAAAAKETSADSAIAVVLSEVKDIFSF